MDNNEIKEILAYMMQYVENKYEHDSEPMLNWKDIKCVLDYITNLQEKINQYENPDDMTLFYMWLDTKAKDKMKQLQKENMKYEQCLTELTDNYKDLQKELTNLQEELESKNKEIKDLKNRLYAITTKFN